MPVISELAVRLAVDSAKFTKELDRVNKRTKSFADQARKNINSIGKAALATATAVGVAGAAIFREQSKQIDLLAKTSDKLGIQTEKLIGLQHAAELTGVATNTMNMAMQRATRRIAEAAKGTGEAKAALIELNINAKELNKLPLDQKMGVIADAMNNVKNQSDRVRLAMKLFDSEGVALVNTLALGSDGLEKMQKEADNLGITLTRIDAAKVEAANDAITRAGAATQGLFRQFTVAIAPWVEAVTNEFVRISSSAMSTKDTISGLVTGIIKGFGLAANVVQGLRFAFTLAKLAVAGLAVGVAIAVDNIIFGFQKAKEKTLEYARKALLPVLDAMGYISEEAFTMRNNLVRAMRDAETATKSTSLVTESLRVTFDGIKQDLDDIATQGLPSEKIEESLRRIQEEATIAAEKIHTVRTGGDAEVGPTALSDIEFPDIPKFADLLDIPSDPNARFGEMLVEREEMTMQHLDNIFNFASSSEERQIELVRNAEEIKNQFRRMSTASQVGFVTRGLQAITSIGAKENKRLFQINKVAGIANAVISTAQGVSNALGSLPPPINFAVAAATAAAGFAQIQKIRSTSFGGGGSVSTPSSGSAANTNSSTDEVKEAATPRKVTLDLGDRTIFRREEVEAIAEALTDFSADDQSLGFA